VLWGLVCGCELSNTEGTRTEIQGLVKQFAEAAQKDVTTMIAMYDQSATTLSIGNGQIQRGIEAIRKSADESLVGKQDALKIELGSIEVFPLGGGYALSVTPFSVTENASQRFSIQRKGISSLVWKKSAEGWKVIHEHESLHP